MAVFLNGKVEIGRNIKEKQIFPQQGIPLALVCFWEAGYLDEVKCNNMIKYVSN